MNKRTMAAMAAAMGFASICFCASAATYYVDGNAAAGGDGTAEAPFQTIADGITAASEGDVVEIAAGTYNITNTLTVSKDIIVRGATGNPEDVIIDGASKCRIFDINSSGAVVENVRIYRGKQTSYSDKNGAGVRFGSSGGTLRNCIVERCEIDQNTDSSYGAIYITGGALVTGCVVRDIVNNMNCSVTGMGVYIDNGTLEKSLVVGCRRATKIHGRGAKGAVYLKQGTVDRCTIVGNTLMNGPLTVENKNTCIVHDTIVWGNIGYRESGAGKPNVDIGAKAVANVSGLCTTGEIGTNPLMANPSFIDEANGDYRLSPASPCIGAGTGGCDLGYADYTDSAAKAGIHVSSYAGCGSCEATVTLVPAAGVSVASVTWSDSVEELSETGTSFTHTFGVGLHTLTAHVTYGDGTSGDVTLADAIKVTHLGVINVATSDELNAALDLAGEGTEIRVAAGNYELARDNYFFTDAVRIIGPEDRTTAVLTKASKAAKTGRFFYLGHANAAVCNLTMKNAASQCPGGGIWIAGDGGTVSNCVIQGCSADASQGAGGVLMESAKALLTHSLVTGNTSGSTNGKGGGVYLSEGTIANCMIVTNVAGNCAKQGNFGGGVYMASSTANAKIVNCTIAENMAYTGGGIYRVADAGYVYNTISYANTVQSGNKDIYVIDAAKPVLPFATCIVNCCSSTNIGENCQMVSDAPYESDTYELSGERSALCIDKGNNDFVVSETDYAGVARIFNGTVDIGAFEYSKTDIKVSFTVDKKLSAGAATFTFTASLVGGDITTALCNWYLDGAGEVAYTGITYAPTLGVGVHAVRLVVTLNGKDYACEDRAACTVYPTDAYVAADGASVWPYDTPATAATNLNEAVYDVLRSGVTLHVAAGAYPITNTIEVSDGERVVGPEEGEAVVYPRKGEMRIVTINGIGAWVECLCVSNGHAHGGGVYITGNGGTFIRGRITSCKGSTNQAGGGALIDSANGVISRTVFVDNQTEQWKDAPDGPGVDYSGGGVALTAGVVENCLFIGNKANTGGAVEVLYGTVRNCTIVGNTAGRNDKANGGGVKYMSGTLVNNVVWGNTDLHAAAGTLAQDIAIAEGAKNIDNCCVPVACGKNCVTNNPQFCDAAIGDYRLQDGSPCHRAGLYQDWMADATDFFGEARCFHRNVDIGYHQLPPKPVMFFVR